MPFKKLDKGFDGEVVDTTTFDEGEMPRMWSGSFLDDVLEKRVAVLCPLAPNPILLDVVAIDEQMRMMKVKAVTPEGGGREWWLSLRAVITVAVVPKDSPLVQPVTGGVILT